METTQVSAVWPGVSLPSGLHEDDLTDLFIKRGQIGDISLSSGCYSWAEVLNIVAAELWRCGEADAARVRLKAGDVTVRRFLRERFGIVTGRREFWHRPQWTPDRADLQELLGVLRACRQVT